MTPRTTGLLGGTLLLAAAYYAAARLGLQLQFEATQATPVWPPSGIAFAALLLFGGRFAGGILLGAFCANLVDFYVKAPGAAAAGIGDLMLHVAGHPEHVLASALIGLGNMLEALIGAHLVRRLAGAPDVSGTVADVFWFVLASLACSTLASTLGVATLLGIDALPHGLAPAAWFTWWLGDATGIWIIAPLILAWARATRAELTPQRWRRAAPALAVLIGLGALTFSMTIDRALDGTLAHGLTPVVLKTLAYLLIPWMLWIEFRFGHLPGTVGITATAAIAVLGTARGAGPFVGASQNESLLVLQGFIGVASIAVLLLDAALRERRRALAALTHARDQLELRVAERTTELSREAEARKRALDQLESEIAERRRAEEILHQSQKLEALGQFTGGIAHDFNNLLTVILGSLGIAERLAAGNEHLKRMLNAARRAADRGAGLTQDLLTFSRRQPLRAEVFRPADRLRGTINLLRRSLNSDIALELDAHDGGRAVEADPGQLELALLNIGLNARDAMPGGGTLRIAVTDARLDDPPAGLVGDFVAISVTDTGTGIPPEVQARAFEPFFTTKEVGKGSGLGLSQAYGFARQSGGTITLDSAVGRGTTVTLYLPATTGAPPATAEVPAAEVEAPVVPAARVLVVEDDPDVAELATQLIGELGYAVEVATGARAALDVLQRGQPIDLVFSDIMMPGGMNGVDLGQAVRSDFPDTAVLLATGYSEAASGAAANGFTLITKPYHARELAGAIARLIQAQRQARAGTVPLPG